MHQPGIETENNEKALQVRGFLETEQWEPALENVRLLLESFEAEDGVPSYPILQAYERLISVLIEFENRPSQSIQADLKKVLKVLPSTGYDLERFLCNYSLGLSYLSSGKEKDAYVQFRFALLDAKLISNEVKLKYLNKTIPLFINANKNDIVLTFLKEKLLLLSKGTDETEYVKTILLLITYLMQTEELGEVAKYFELIKDIEYISKDKIKTEIEGKAQSYIQKLIKKNGFDTAIEFLRSSDLRPDQFLEDFRPLSESFSKKPSLPLAKTLINLFTLHFSRPASLEIIKLWQQEISPLVYDLLIATKFKLMENEDLKPLLTFVLTDEQVAKNFVYSLSNMTDYLLKDPTEKGIMSYLLCFSETLLDKGYNEPAKIVHSWISTVLDLRKMNLGKPVPNTIKTTLGQVKSSTNTVTSKEMTLTDEVICNVFRRTEGTFAPLPLIKMFFEDQYKKNHHAANANLCNQLAEFIDKISVIVYSSPESSVKTEILREINVYNDTIASGYEYLLWDRMKRQDISLLPVSPEQATKTIINNLIANISIKNPSPFARCLENTMARWAFFPSLETKRYEYPGTRIIALKPIFWMIIYNFLFFSSFDSVYRRLPQNEQLHHKYMQELIRSNLNFYYQFQQCLMADPTNIIPTANIRNDIIKYLKKMNEMVQLSDEELREIVNSSQWKNESTKILSDVIEDKNYCIHCSYNMPLGTKKCPNCGKDVTEIPEESPSIDFKVMGSFFGEQKKSPGQIEKKPKIPPAQDLHVEPSWDNEESDSPLQEGEKQILILGKTLVESASYDTGESYRAGSAFNEIKLTNKRIILIWRAQNRELRWREVNLKDLSKMEKKFDTLTLEGNFDDEQKRGPYHGIITLKFNDQIECNKWQLNILLQQKEITEE